MSSANQAIHDKSEDGPRRSATFREAFFVWLKIGFLSFGGPAGQIALMHRVVVEEKKWIDEEQFLHALNFCMLLPGPEAQQLATYVGWLLHRTLGGVIAGLLFVLPGALIILVLSVLYAAYADLVIVEGLFFGIKAAVIAIVIEAVLRISKRALRNRFMYAVAAIAFISIFLFAVPFPLIVLAAGLVGFAGAKLRPGVFMRSGAQKKETAIGGPPISIRGTAGTAAVCLALWALPVAALYFTLGPDNVFTQQGLFFSKMAVVTFGGAYAVLAYVAQQAVEVFAWLSPSEMVDGLGLAETTPGPLIMVLQFVGFLGAYRAETGLDPMLAGILGAALTTWVTFAPCFLWIFLGAPFIERLRGARALNAALSTITSAVVGVVLNLAVWFSAHVLFGTVERVEVSLIHTIMPDPASLNPVALAISAAALIAMLRFKVSMLIVLGSAGAIGAGAALLG